MSKEPLIRYVSELIEKLDEYKKLTIYDGMFPIKVLYHTSGEIDKAMWISYAIGKGCDFVWGDDKREEFKTITKNKEDDESRGGSQDD